MKTMEIKPFEFVMIALISSFNILMDSSPKLGCRWLPWFYNEGESIKIGEETFPKLQGLFSKP